SNPLDQLFSKVQTAATTSLAPADVIFLSQEAPSKIVAPGYMLPLQDFMSKSKANHDFSDFQRLDFWKRNGNQYGITTYVQMVMLDYNQARLRQAGYSSPPATWSELEKQALALKQKGVQTYPVCFGIIDWSWYLMSLSMGDPMFDASIKPTFSQAGSPARQAMAMLFRMFGPEKLITPAMLTASTPHEVYESGIGVFHQAWQGADRVMNNPKVSKQAPNDRYMLMPDKHYTWSLDAAIGISKYSKAQAAAWTFIEWYLGPDIQLAIYDAYGLMPSRASVQKQLGSQGKIFEYDLQRQQAQHVRQLPRFTPWWGQWADFVTAAIRKGLQGNQPADSVVDSIAQKWAQLQKQQG
ncbi:MAG: extracellular solute-binding protein, partial [Chloroflexota bacterium]